MAGAGERGFFARGDADVPLGAPGGRRDAGVGAVVRAGLGRANPCRAAMR